MRNSLRCVDLSCQRTVDPRSSARLLWGMSHLPEDRQALGRRLSAARKLAGLTLQAVATALTARGHKIGKAAVGAWESGRNVPDALWLRRLAKLYGTTLDALVWDDAITIEAIRFAVQYDGLTEKQRRAFRAMWLAYFEQATSDEDVEEHLPSVPRVEPVRRH